MNTSKIISLCVILSLADFGTTILCTRWLGWGITYTLFAIPMILGLLIQRRRWRVMDSINRSHHELSPVQKLKVYPQEMTQWMCWMLTTILLLIPGLVTASLGFASMVNPVRGWIERPLFRFHRRIAKMKIRDYQEKENPTGRLPFNERLQARLKAQTDNAFKEMQKRKI